MSIYLKSIRLVNIQSWKDNTINLSNGLNVICAPNNTGKSVIFKSLKIAINPNDYMKYDRLDIIRKGCSFGTIYYLFSDNSVYEITVNLKENLYYKIEDLTKSKEREYLGTSVPKDLIAKLGIITDGNIIANLIDMDQNMFLVNSDDNVNFGILKVLTVNDDLEKLKHSLKTKRIQKAKDNISRIVADKAYIENLLSHFKYVDLNGKEENLNFFKGITASLDVLVPCHDDLENINNYQKDYHNEEELIDIVECLDNVYSQLSGTHQCKEYEDNTVPKLEVLELLNSSLTQSDYITKFEDYNINLKSVVDDLSVLDINLTELNKVSIMKSIDNELVDVVSNSYELLEILNNAIDIGDLSKENEELEKSISELGGEEVECPIYGKITYINKECIH